MSTWPGQVIFGFYFAIVATATHTLHEILVSRRHRRPAQALVLFCMIGLGLDLVLVNIQETVVHVDASYGLVVLWDAATFFAWIRVVDLCGIDSEQRFRSSWVVSMATLLPLGREILFLPYSPFSWRAYIDLLFGNVAVSLWAFVDSRPSLNKVGRQYLLLLVFAGCLYWSFNGIENIVGLAWSPLGPEIYQLFDRVGMPVASLSLSYAAISLVGAISVKRWNLLGLGERFGLVVHCPD